MKDVYGDIMKELSPEVRREFEKATMNSPILNCSMRMGLPPMVTLVHACIALVKHTEKLQEQVLRRMETEMPRVLL